MTSASLEARVLVYDPDFEITEKINHHLEERFGRGNVGTEGSGRPVELTCVTSLDDLTARVLSHNPVHYSLVVYPLTEFKEGNMGNIARIHKYDPFMPQMVVGDFRTRLTDSIIDEVLASLESFPGVEEGSISLEYLKPVIETWIKSAVLKHVTDTSILGKMERVGVLHSAANDAQIKSNLQGAIFKELHPLPNLVVVKIGGSALDALLRNPLDPNLGVVLSELSAIHAQREYYEEVYVQPYTKKHVWKDETGIHEKVIHKPGRRVSEKVTRVQRILITVGGGPPADFYKALFRLYSRTHPALVEGFPKVIANVHQNNLQALSHLLKPDPLTGHGGAELLTSGAYYRINETSTSQTIPLIATAPHWYMVKQGIPLTDSDTQTFALANLFGAKRVVMFKCTDGIYDLDPRRGFIESHKPPYGCADPDAYRHAQRHNKLHAVVDVNAFLNGSIQREGTNPLGQADGTYDHLAETSSLRYFRDDCTHLEEIAIGNIAPSDFYYRDGESGFRHFITRERLELDRGGWHAHLRRTVRDAIRGRANSIIVRNPEYVH